MTSKVCPKCLGKSYSASPRGDWICPYCGEELANVPINDNFNEKSAATNSTNNQRKALRNRFFVIEGGNLQKRL